MTVTITATDSDCNCPKSDTFTLIFKHVCHTATITPSDLLPDAALVTSLLGAPDTLTFTAYTLSVTECGPIAYSLVELPAGTTWTNAKVSFATDGDGVTTVTLNPDSLSYGSEDLTGTLYVKASVTAWTNIVVNTAKSFTWTISDCSITSIADPTITPDPLQTGVDGSSGNPFVYTVYGTETVIKVKAMKALEDPLCNFDLTYTASVKYKADGETVYGTATTIPPPDDGPQKTLEFL